MEQAIEDDDMTSPARDFRGYGANRPRAMAGRRAHRINIT